MMARRETATPRGQEKDDLPAPEPVDVVDGIPDRSAKPAAWKLLVLVLVFLAWACLLVFCAIAGAPTGAD